MRWAGKFQSPHKGVPDLNGFRIRSVVGGWSGLALPSEPEKHRHDDGQERNKNESGEGEQERNEDRVTQRRHDGMRGNAVRGVKRHSQHPTEVTPVYLRKPNILQNTQSLDTVLQT